MDWSNNFKKDVARIDFMGYNLMDKKRENGNIHKFGKRIGRR